MEIMIEDVHQQQKWRHSQDTQSTLYINTNKQINKKDILIILYHYIMSKKRLWVNYGFLIVINKHVILKKIVNNAILMINYNGINSKYNRMITNKV